MVRLTADPIANPIEDTDQYSRSVGAQDRREQQSISVIVGKQSQTEVPDQKHGTGLIGEGQEIIALKDSDPSFFYQGGGGFGTHGITTEQTYDGSVAGICAQPKDR